MTSHARRLGALTVAGLVSASCAAHAPAGPPPAAAPNPCATTLCRPAKTIILQRGKSQFIVPAPAAPTVDNDVVMVRPGDDFYVTADDRDGALANIRRIDPPAGDAPNVIHFTYKQEQLPNGSFVMLLDVHSSFPRPLVYRALALSPERPLFVTSTCPLNPGLTSIEMWPEPLWQLLLRNFRASDDNRICKVY